MLSLTDSKAPQEIATSASQIWQRIITCASLENLEVSCGLPYKIHETGTRDTSWLDPYQAWRFSVDFLSHLQVDSLRHLTIDLPTDHTPCNDPHRLPWSEMRDVLCRYNDTVHSLTFRLNPPDTDVDMKSCVAYELMDFQLVSEYCGIRPYRFHCGHADCEEYYQEIIVGRQ